MQAKTLQKIGLASKAKSGYTVFTELAKRNEMNKQQYQAARKLIRENGFYAIRWLRMSEASIMLQLQNLARKPDRLQNQNWRYPNAMI